MWQKIHKKAIASTQQSENFREAWEKRRGGGKKRNIDRDFKLRYDKDCIGFNYSAKWILTKIYFVKW